MLRFKNFISLKQFLYKTIKKVSKYLNLDLAYFAHKGKYLLLAHIVSVLMRLLFSVILARFLSKAIYGQYSFILSIVGTLIIFTLPGMNHASIIASAQKKDGFYLQALKSKLKFSIFGVLSLIGISIYFYITNNPNLALPILIAALFFIPFYVFLIYLAFLNGKKQFKRYSLYYILLETIPILITIIVLLLSKNLTLIILSWFGITSLLNIYFLKKTLKLRENNIGDEKLVSYGKSLTFIGLISSILVNIDKLIVTYFLGFGNLAIYTIAGIFPTQLKRLLKEVGIPLIFPGFSVLDKKEVYKKIRKRLWLLFSLGVLVSLIGALLIPYIILLFYGVKYTNSIFYARLLFLSMVFGLPSIFILSGVLIPQKRKKELYVINTLIPLANLVLLLILIPKFGLLGAVLSRLFSRIIGFILSLIALFRLKGERQ